MEKKLWAFVSYLFHPALMPTLGTFIVMWNDPYLFIPLETTLAPWIVVLSVVFICTYILPVLLSFVLLKMGRISSISQPTENDRRLLLGFTALCFILVYYSFHNFPSSVQSLKIFMLGINISIIATLITSLFTKISFHSVGVGGLFGTVIGLMRYTHENLFLWLGIAFVIMCLTALSRYKLKAHGAFEIYIGLILGIAVNALVFFINTNSANSPF